MATIGNIATNSVTAATNVLTNTVTNALNNAEAAVTSPFFSNPAPTSIVNGGAIFELKSPSLPNGGYFYTAGSQTVPGLARGALVNSALLNNNVNLSHVCDFKFTFSDGLSFSGLINPIAALQNAVKNGKMAAANAIRAAINQLQQGFRAIVTALLSALCADPTGIVSLQVSAAKYYIRLVNEAINRAAQIVYDVSLIVNLAKDITQIITYIESLPKQLQAILKDCLKNFQTSLNQSVQSAKSATNLKTTINQSINQSTNNANQYNSATNNAILNAASGTPTQATVNAITASINSTVSNSPPSFGSTANTASQP